MSIKVIKSTGEVFIRDTAGQEVKVRVIGDSVVIGKMILELTELETALRQSRAIWIVRNKNVPPAPLLSIKPEENL